MSKPVSIISWILELPQRISKLLDNRMKLLGIVLTGLGVGFLCTSIWTFDIFENASAVVLLLLGLYLWDTYSTD